MIHIMLDIKLLREEPEKVKQGVADKGVDPKLIDVFLALDARWRAIKKELDDLKAAHNKLSDKRNIPAAREIKVKLQAKEEEARHRESELDAILKQIPNMPLPDVPRGKGESENVVVREVGRKPEFGFVPKDHLELGTTLDILDFGSGAKVAGSGFYYLKNAGVLLELALVHYALDFLAENGFTLWLTPDVAREKFYLGTGYQPRGPEAQTYVIQDSNLGLIATGEVTLAGIHAGVAFDEDSLPKLYAGYSHCFRQEDGAYGKYSKGLYRVHQFTKVEMFVYCRPEDSPGMHEKILELEEKLWQSLGIPYRVLEMCTGDLGAQSARKFDLEAWMSGRGDWGEVTSASNTTDYQARRLDIRFRRQKGKWEFVHTLNGTALATSRAIVAILENYQTKEGKVKVPEVLRKYVGKEIIG